MNLFHRIALLRLSALGDVILMVPVVRAIQRHFPEAQVTWLTGRPAYTLLEGLSGVEFIVIDKPRSINDYRQLHRELKSRKFDVLLAAQASLRTNLIYPFIHAPIKVGFDASRSRDGHGFFISQRISARQEHLLEGFMQFAQALKVRDCSLTWDLPIAQSDWDWARQQLSQRSGKWLAINPMASKRERNWPISRYAELIRGAVARWQVNVVITGGNGTEEKAFATQLIAMAGIPCFNCVGLSSLKQLAALLGSVDVLVSPDTGPVHLADAMGTAVVGLYAVARPELSGPYRSSSLVVNVYPEAVATFLHRDPHTVPWGTRVHHRAAMSLISVQSVMEKLARVLCE